MVTGLLRCFRETNELLFFSATDEDDEDEEAGDMDQFMADDEIEETDTKVGGHLNS